MRLLTEVFDRERSDEVHALAAREAAGPFVTRGRIRPHGVERLVVDGPPPGARHAGGADRPAGRPVVVDTPAGGGATPERPSKGRRRAVNAGGMDAGSPVVLESDGAIVERFHDPRRPVWLFGAGHVGRALMLALAPLPFDVTWVDERADAFPGGDARQRAFAAEHRSGRRGGWRSRRRPDRRDDPQPCPGPRRRARRARGGTVRLRRAHRVGQQARPVRAEAPRGRRRAGARRGARLSHRPPDHRLQAPGAIAAGVAVQLLERDEADAASATPESRGIVAGAAQ